MFFSGHSSSPFGSGSSSLRNTPDLFMESQELADNRPGSGASGEGTPAGASYNMPYGVSPTPNVESSNWPPPQRPAVPQPQAPRPGSQMVQPQHLSPHPQRAPPQVPLQRPVPQTAPAQRLGPPPHRPPQDMVNRGQQFMPQNMQVYKRWFTRAELLLKTINQKPHVLFRIVPGLMF